MKKKISLWIHQKKIVKMYFAFTTFQTNMSKGYMWYPVQKLIPP